METIVSTTVGIIIGGFLSWLITWRFALKGKEEDNARHQELLIRFQSVVNESSIMSELVKKALEIGSSEDNTSRIDLLNMAEASHQRVTQAAKLMCPVKDCAKELGEFLGMSDNHATGITTHYYRCPIHGRVPGGYDDLISD